MERFAKPFVFERESNCYNLLAENRKKSNFYKHLFVPWSSLPDSDFMFKIKADLKNNTEVVLPFGNLSIEDEKRLSEQLELGAETHLVMSNLSSIHILRVRAVYKFDHKSVQVYKESSKLFQIKNSTAQFWLSVDDLFVFRGGHCENTSLISQELERFISTPIEEKIFLQWEGISSSKTFKNTDKWVLQDRSLTYEYFFKSIELEDNIFGRLWPLLFKRARHEITLASLKKYDAGGGDAHEKFLCLKESFDAYYRSVAYELNDLYILPLISEIRKEQVLFNEWTKVAQIEAYSKIGNIMGDLINCHEMTISSMTEIVEYLKCAKSFIFTLKNRFTKRIHTEEYLFLENFLAKSTSLVDSFTIKGLDKKTEHLIKIDEWVKRNAKFSHACSHYELSSCNLRFQNILTMLMSSDEQNNFLLKLCSEKDARSLFEKKNMDKESASLLANDLESIASHSLIKKVA